MYCWLFIFVREECIFVWVIGNVGLIFIVVVVGGICVLDILCFLCFFKYILGKDDVIFRGKLVV